MIRQPLLRIVCYNIYPPNRKLDIDLPFDGNPSQGISVLSVLRNYQYAGFSIRINNVLYADHSTLRMEF